MTRDPVTPSHEQLSVVIHRRALCAGHKGETSLVVPSGSVVVRTALLYRLLYAAPHLGVRAGKHR